MTVEASTAIGQRLHDAPWRLYAAGIIGLIVIELDFLLVWTNPLHPGRVWLALAFLLYLPLVRWDRNSLGLAWRPVQGWWPWLWTGLILGAAVSLFTLLALGAMGALHVRLPVPRTPPEGLWDLFVHACVKYPLIEEGIYRLAFCVPAVAYLGQRGAVVSNGLVFAILHIVYGTPTPDNQIAGYILAWVFLHSRCILVPLAFHAIGNVGGVVLEAVAWYFNIEHLPW